MALLQLTEPGQSTKQTRKFAVGIDLGTTNSLVAYVDEQGQAHTLADQQGRHLLPSVVYYGEQGDALVGHAAREKAIHDPLNTIISVKRFMGRSLSDIQKQHAAEYEFRDTGSVPRIETARGSISAIEVSGEILKNLRLRAEEFKSAPLDGVVITVPAYFDDAQRQATKDAAKLVGLNVLRLLNEPTAAAVAYGLDNEAEGVHAVFDLGGGTFDITILRLHKGVFEVLSTAGDTALGGDDLDRALTKWIMAQAGIELPDAKQFRYLMESSKAVKETLSKSETAQIKLDKVGIQWQGEIRRGEFNNLIRDLVKRALIISRRAVKDAGISVQEVKDVVMVGGSTRVPLVREMVEDYFQAPPLVDIDPDRVVAIGAAIQADVLVGNKTGKDVLLLDVIPLSLGLETMGGLVEKLIHRNTTIPVAKAQEFTTAKDGQTALSIHVVQGEREMVADCRSLARFELRGFPSMLAGAPRIRVSYQVDADGLLSVSAEETTSGTKASIQIKPSYGLQDSEIEQMIRDSFEHAEEDVRLRNLRIQQVEAQRVLDALQSAIDLDGHLLDEADREKIETHSQHLREVMQGDDRDGIKQAIEDLEKVCVDFVSTRMNANISKVLQGQSIDEVDD